MFTAAKDALAGEAARRYLNSLIARYGTLQELKIDSKNQRMNLVCVLDGESAPVVVSVEKYKIQESGGKKTMEIVACTSSRPWLQSLLTDFVCGRAFEVPAWVAAAL